MVIVISTNNKSDQKVSIKWKEYYKDCYLFPSNEFIIVLYVDKYCWNDIIWTTY